jgi:hypothetical protein
VPHSPSPHVALRSNGLDSRSGGPQTPLRVARDSRKTVPQRDYILDTGFAFCYRLFMDLRFLALRGFFSTSTGPTSCFSTPRTCLWNIRLNACSVVNSIAFFLAKVDSQ